MDAPRRRVTKLEPHRHEILDLYFDKECTLKQIKKHIKDKYGIDASDRQYKWLWRFQNSGRSKNLSTKDWNHIVPIVRAREQSNKRSEVLWDGKVIDENRLQRELLRYNSRMRTRPLDLSADSRARIKIRTPPATQPCSPNFVEQSASEVDVAVETSVDRPSSIYVPSEAMSENDYSSMGVIVREICLSGIPIFGRSGQIIQEISPELFWALSCPLASEASFSPSSPVQNSIPRSLSHTWAWEALASILASDPSEFSRLQSVTPGFPAAANRVLLCSKAELLNMTINTVINHTGTVGLVVRAKLLEWLSNDTQYGLLQRMFKTRSERMISLVWSFLFEVIRNIRSMGDLSGICRAVNLVLPTAKESMSQPLKFWTPFDEFFRQRRKYYPLHSRQNFIIRKVRGRFRPTLRSEDWQRVKVMINSGTSRHGLIRKLSRNFHSTIRQEDYCSEGFISYLVDIHPILSNVGIVQHFFNEKFNTCRRPPLTFAEDCAFISPALAKALRPCILDPFSLELFNTLVDIDHSRKGSALAMELALFGAARHQKTDLSRLLLESGVNPNCPHLESLKMSLNNVDAVSPQQQPFHSIAKRRGTLFSHWAKTFTELPLDIAIESSDGLTVHYLLEAGAKPSLDSFRNVLFDYPNNCKIEHFFQPLHATLRRPELIISTGIYFLYYAIMVDNRDLIRDLSRQGVPLNKPVVVNLKCYPERRLHTPLSFAFLFGNEETLNLLWNLGSRFKDEPPLSGLFEAHQVCSNAFSQPVPSLLEKLRFLIVKGVSFGAAYKPDSDTGYTHTILQSFLESLSFRKCSNLPRNEIEDARTALRAIEILILGGADVNSHQSTEQTPLQMATRCRHFDIMKLLIGHGADVNLARGGTAHSQILAPLALAAGEVIDQHHKDRSVEFSLPSSEVCEYLIHNGADVNGVSPLQTTAVAAACSAGNLDCVRLLITHGANIHLPSSMGQVHEFEAMGTPLQHVCHGKRNGVSVQIAELLIEMGADVNAVATPFTALQLACCRGLFNLVLVLLESGADIDGPCACYPYISAIEIAASVGGFDIVKMLVNAGAEKNITKNRFSGAITFARAARWVHISNYLEGVNEDVTPKNTCEHSNWK